MKLPLAMLACAASACCYAQEISLGQIRLHLADSWKHSHVYISEELVSPQGDTMLFTVLKKGTVGYESMKSIVFEHVLLDSATYEKSRLIKPAATYETNNGHAYRLIQFKRYGNKGYELGGSMDLEQALICFTYISKDKPENAAAQIKQILSGMEVSPKAGAAF